MVKTYGWPYDDLSPPKVVERVKSFPEVGIYQNFPSGKIIFGNSKYATLRPLNGRDDYEKKMITLLEMNAVDSWESFKRFLSVFVKNLHYVPCRLCNWEKATKRDCPY